MNSDPTTTVRREDGERNSALRWCEKARGAARTRPIVLVTMLHPHVVCRAAGRSDRIAFAAWPRSEWDAARAAGRALGPPEVAGPDLARATPHLLPTPYASVLIAFRNAIVTARPLAGAVRVRRARPL